MIPEKRIIFKVGKIVKNTCVNSKPLVSGIFKSTKTISGLKPFLIKLIASFGDEKLLMVEFKNLLPIISFKIFKTSASSSTNKNLILFKRHLT